MSWEVLGGPGMPWGDLRCLGRSWEVTGVHKKSWEVPGRFLGGHGRSWHFWEVLGGLGMSWEAAIRNSSMKQKNVQTPFYIISRHVF